MTHVALTESSVAAYLAGNAISSRSKCAYCKESILKGALRIGIAGNFRGHPTIKWFEPACFEREIEGHEIFPSTMELSEKDFSGAEKLSESDRKKLGALIKRVKTSRRAVPRHEKSGGSKMNTQQVKKKKQEKKRPRDASEEDDDDARAKRPKKA